jgi:hypothetical protein
VNDRKDTKKQGKKKMEFEKLIFQCLEADSFLIPLITVPWLRRSRCQQQNKNAYYMKTKS